MLLGQSCSLVCDIWVEIITAQWEIQKLYCKGSKTNGKKVISLNYTFSDIHLSVTTSTMCVHLSGGTVNHIKYFTRRHEHSSGNLWVQLLSESFHIKAKCTFLKQSGRVTFMYRSLGKYCFICQIQIISGDWLADELQRKTGERPVNGNVEEVQRKWLSGKRLIGRLQCTGDSPGPPAPRRWPCQD